MLVAPERIEQRARIASREFSVAARAWVSLLGTTGLIRCALAGTLCRVAVVTVGRIGGPRGGRALCGLGAGRRRTQRVASVGSVTGSVGRVTGSVGRVTGSVGRVMDAS